MKYSLLMLVIFTAMPLMSLAAAPVDSLALENEKGQLYVIHKVEKQETLYRLLKRYNCSPAEVLAANPTIDASSTIFENQVLRIPYKNTSGKSVVLPTANEKSAATEPIGDDVQKNLKRASTQPNKLYHVVAEGETLYAISKLYDISIEKLQKANQLTDNAIAVNQKLIVSEKYTPNAPAGDENNKTVLKNLPKNPSDYVPNAPTGHKVTETGIATLINAGSSSNKHVALHRFAPVGSQVKVKNDATGDVVWVKVIGKLQNTGDNQNVIIKLSPVAFNKLNPRDSRIRAVVAYDMPLN